MILLYNHHLTLSHIRIGKKKLIKRLILRRTTKYQFQVNSNIKTIIPQKLP